MNRQSIDASAVTFLPVCSCGWRGMPEPIRSRAWRSAADHARAAHGAAEAATSAAERCEQRERGRHARP